MATLPPRIGATYPCGAHLAPPRSARGVLRGGSWNNNPQNLRAAYRNNNPDNRIFLIGFRVARTLFARAGAITVSPGEHLSVQGHP